MTPTAVHHGQAQQIHAARATVLEAAYARNPERFVCKSPIPPELPTAAWINKPETKEVAHQLRPRSVSPSLTGLVQRSDRSFGLRLQVALDASHPRLSCGRAARRLTSTSDLCAIRVLQSSQSRRRWGSAYALQPGAEVRGPWPSFGCLVQALVDEGRKRCMYLVQSRRVGVEVLLAKILKGRTGERPAARDQLERGHADCVDVSRRRCALATPLLGGRIRRR
jgi:hypothetical protein